MATVGKPTHGSPVTQPAATHIHPNPDGTISVEWFAPRPMGQRRIGRRVGELQVWFESEAAAESSPLAVKSVRLTLDDEGLTATKLQRFPWARLLGVAHAASAATAEDSWDAANEILENAFARAWPEIDGAPRRPGRRGHPDKFYREIAMVYAAAAAAGIRRRDEFFAELCHSNANTVRGWAREARRRGYLPRAQPGRPRSGDAVLRSHSDTMA